MRTILLACLVFCFLSSNLRAQEVPEVQKTMITKITATWCPNCGSWGWDFFEEIIDGSTLQKAVFVGAHHSGTLDSDAGEAFSSNFNAPYQPYFYAGNQDLGVNSGNVSDKVTETRNLINNNANNSPVANVGLDATLAGNTLTLTTKTLFFQATEGEYYLGLYILENNVIAAQASNSDMASHPFVLRTSITNDIFGPEVANGSINAGTEVTDQSVTYELNDSWDFANLSVMGVLWKKEGNTYQFVNVNATSEFSTVAVQSISEDIAQVSLNPSLATDQTQLTVQINQSSLNVNIHLYDLQGRLQKSIFKGTLTEGLQTFDISTSGLVNGKYFVSMTTEDGRVLTKRLAVQR
jgi:hypothetical protein